MTFEEYQRQSRQTAAYPTVGGKGFLYPVLGLAGESGELANKVKKIFRDDKGELTDEKKEDIAQELGDILWYVAQVAAELGLSLEDVVQKNLEKLLSRQARNVLSGSGDDR